MRLQQEAAKNAEKPAVQEIPKQPEIRIAYKSPFNTGMSEVLISNYIG